VFSSLLALMAVPDLQAAISHLQQKNVDAAITMLEEKIDELPAHLTAHVLLARAYEARGRWEDALQCWENVRFLMPNSPVAKDGKARILRRLGQSGTQTSASAGRSSAGEVSPNGTAPSGKDEASDAASAEADDPAAPDAPPTAPDSPEAPTADDEPEADAEEEDAEEALASSPTTAAEAVSELEQLRQQAEEKARQGGARPNMSPGSTAPDTPEERVEQLEDDDDLDRLIDELESARIEPRPEMDEVPEPDLDSDVDDIVSETLARIHEAQDQYRKAAQIYVKLASQEPDQARAYLQKASEMREQAEAQEAAEADEPENAESS
jgi:tetratricopeptide (TPR) repeat protein